MTTMLVSFPLSFPANFSLATLDYDSGAVAWVDLQGVGEDVKGINGMVAHRGHYWCLAETDTGDKLIAFDAALNLVYKQDLAKSRSTHTIIPHRDGFLVANTGYNGVTYLELTPDGVKEDVIWRFVENDKDQVHVNSVAELGGKVFVSMFGYRAEGIVQGGWSSATNGQVVNITDNTVIAEGLLSPHTLVVHEGALYWLESRRGRVYRYTEGEGASLLCELQGFLRGLAFDGPHMYVAASASRRRSRSTGELFEKTTDLHTLQSWVYQLDRETAEVVRELPLTMYGEEIFELLVLDEAASLPERPPIDPAIFRLWAIRDVYLTWEQEAILRRTELRDMAKGSLQEYRMAVERGRRVKERERLLRERASEIKKMQEQSLRLIERVVQELKDENEERQQSDQEDFGKLNGVQKDRTKERKEKARLQGKIAAAIEAGGEADATAGKKKWKHGEPLDISRLEAQAVE